MTVEEALRIKLTERRGPVYFSDLRAHLERDGVFVVRADVDLVECGIAIAQDDVARVQIWIREGKLRKPSKSEYDSWPENPRRQWLSVIVQPFVLVQDAPDAAEPAPTIES
ncbi:MAG: DUF2288 family protein, partial [Myxococcales bacterium]|nr:DUF2288 family protein [Myxococcales bacterium]